MIVWMLGLMEDGNLNLIDILEVMRIIVRSQGLMTI